MVKTHIRFPCPVQEMYREDSEDVLENNITGNSRTNNGKRKEDLARCYKTNSRAKKATSRADSSEKCQGRSIFVSRIGPFIFPGLNAKLAFRKKRVINLLNYWQNYEWNTKLHLYKMRRLRLKTQTISSTHISHSS